MKVEASVPSYLPTSTQQKYVKTAVVPQQDGTHKIQQVHYLTTLYDAKGSLSTTQRTWSQSYLV